MARVSFTDNLTRHIACPPTEQPGGSVADVLAGVFAQNPPLKSYIPDDQGRLRKHVAVFVNDAMIADRAGLSDPVRETLAFGSTTGNLWVGEGGGARWTQVSGALPPIAQVLFA